MSWPSTLQPVRHQSPMNDISSGLVLLPPLLLEHMQKTEVVCVTSYNDKPRLAIGTHAESEDQAAAFRSAHNPISVLQVSQRMNYRS